MYRLLFILPLLLIGSLEAKECYWEKDKKVCLKRYYNLKKLKDPDLGKKHYINPKNNQVYTFYDQIQIKLKYKGAILYILENFEVEFFDKKNYGTLILKAKSPEDTLSIITNLNHLDSVRIAKPFTKRVYRKSYRGPKYEIIVPEKKKKPGKVPEGANLKNFKID